MVQELKLLMDDTLSLRDVVCETLRRAILDGTLRPGERLMELHLARQLGVSRTPVREALRRLETDGLVETIPNRGAMVAQITVRDVEDVLEVREAMEELAVRRACCRITAAQLAQLYAAEARFEECLRKDDLAGAARADAAFHEVLCEAAGNRRLIQLLSDLRSHLYRYRLEYLKNKKSHAGLVSQHALICEAVKSRDEENAAQAVRSHIRRQKLSLAESIRQQITTP